MQQDQIHKEAGVAATRPISQSDTADLPQCCGTGCTVCVLDYPELFSTGQSDNRVDPETLAMLEAIEQAQSQAQSHTGRVVVETGSELQ